MPVDPTGDDLKRFLAEDIGGPVVMLNMLRFKEGERDKYEEYGRAIAPFLEKYDVHVLYVGDCSTKLVAPKDHDWDMILIARYPSRQTFASMVADPDYQEITSLRSDSLEEAVLQATVPWPDGVPADLPS
jgi:uncharacterized protein (DUF1330 family)